MFTVRRRCGGKRATTHLSKKREAGAAASGHMDHAWFAGFAPADKPQVAFAVLVEHGGFGGEVAAPVARQLVEAALVAPLAAQAPAEGPK